MGTWHVASDSQMVIVERIGVTLSTGRHRELLWNRRSKSSTAGSEKGYSHRELVLRLFLVLSCSSSSPSSCTRLVALFWRCCGCRGAELGLALVWLFCCGVSAAAAVVAVVVVVLRNSDGSLRQLGKFLLSFLSCFIG